MQEEAAAAPEFAAITDYQGADQWGGDQWTSDVAVPPVAPTDADWGVAPGIYCYLLILEFPHLLACSYWLGPSNPADCPRLGVGIVHSETCLLRLKFQYFF